MVRDRLLLRLCGIERDASFLEQAVDQLRVVDDLVLAAEVLVLVGERVEAVRARRDDLANVVLLQHLDVLLGALLEQVLVADPSRRIARALLLGAEDGEVDAGGLEDLRECCGDRLRTIVEGCRAADPVEVFGIGLVGDERDAEVLCPVRARLMRQPVRVGDVLDVAQRRLRLFGHARLVEHEVTAHVHDLRNVLDEHRALIHARATRRARPERLLEDGAADQRSRSRRLGPPPRPDPGESHDGWKCPGRSCAAPGWWSPLVHITALPSATRPRSPAPRARRASWPRTRPRDSRRRGREDR